MNPQTDAFVQALLGWYSAAKRDLPWRNTTDPYAIWVSEIMLQQTQAPRVARSYFPRFMQTFPDVQSLAAANWKTLYPVWRGLGFYRRGKMMLKTAKTVIDVHAGSFPTEYAELVALPGIGPYTAAAVLSFAHDRPFAAVDTNWERILGGVFPTEDVPKLAAHMVDLAPSSRDLNNAMMDLGTALRQNGTTDLSPDLAGFFTAEAMERIKPKRAPKKPTSEKKPKEKSKGKKGRKKVVEVGIACIHRNGQYLLQTRPAGKSFPGMWEFPGGKREKGEDLRACVKRECMEELGAEVSVRPAFMKTVHEFDYVRLVLHFHRCQVQAGTPESKEGQELKWVSPQHFDSVEFLDTNADAVAKLKEMRV